MQYVAKTTTESLVCSKGAFCTVKRKHTTSLQFPCEPLRITFQFHSRQKRKRSVMDHEKRICFSSKSLLHSYFELTGEFFQFSAAKVALGAQRFHIKPKSATFPRPSTAHQRSFLKRTPPSDSLENALKSSLRAPPQLNPDWLEKRAGVSHQPIKANSVHILTNRTR